MATAYVVGFVHLLLRSKGCLIEFSMGMIM